MLDDQLQRFLPVANRLAEHGVQHGDALGARRQECMLRCTMRQATQTALGGLVFGVYLDQQPSHFAFLCFHKLCLFYLRVSISSINYSQETEVYATIKP